MTRLALTLALALPLLSSLRASHLSTPRAVAQPSVERFTFEFLRPDEAALALKHIVPRESLRILAGGRLLLLDPTEAQRAAARALLERLDRPAGGCSTTFVEIHNRPLDAIIDEAFASVAVRHADFHAIPQPRTSRVFLMGHPDDVTRFAEALLNLDRLIDEA